MDMHIELNDAIKIYARACRAWYGKRARKVALERSRELSERGDWEGVKVWETLADEVDKIGHLPSASAFH